MLLCTIVKAQTWTDVTNYFFENPNFKDGKTNGWSVYGRPTESTDGAVYFNGGSISYLYSSANGLAAGRYKLTIYGYYRDGSATADWNRYSSGSYTGNSNAFYYLYYSNKESRASIPCASSNAQLEPLDDTDTKVGNSKYIPSNVNSAAKWFKAGFYRKTIEFVASKGDGCSVEPVCFTNDGNGQLMFGGVKLELQGEVVKHEKIEFKDEIVYLCPGLSGYNYLFTYPENVTVSRYTYSTSNKNVVTVDNYGNLRGVSVGTATITVVSNDGSGVKGSYKVVVKNPQLANKDNISLSEVLVANNGWSIDASGNYGSYVELYNSSDDFVSLDGMYVTDDKDNLKKGAINLFNNVNNTTNIISPRGYRIVSFDNYDAVFAPNMIDFKLRYEGGSLYLTDGKQIVDSVAYPQAIARTSYEKDFNTNEWVLCSYPVPNGRIDKSDYPYLYGKEQVPAPSFSETGGFFTGTKNVTLHVPEGTIVSVTTDGTLPTRYHGDMYVKDTEFEFKKSMPFRAMAYKDGYLNSDVVTTTYILKDKRYVFPIINVVTDEGHLYNDDYGLFVEGYGNGRPGNGKSYSCNWNADWNRPVNFEYITADGEYVLNQEVDMSTCGGWSRAWEPHSFKLKANKYYLGLNTMNVPFFKDKPNIRHKVLQIRNGGNDNKCRFIDPSIQEIVRNSGLNVNSQCWQPVHVFINGKYQTVLNMREPNNKHYAYSNYGYDTDEVDQFEMSPDSGYVQKSGTPDKFNEWYDLSASSADPVSWEQICKIVDIDEFINYMAVELFLANQDWPQNNVKGFRAINDGKFHFVLFDLDQSNELSESPFKAFERKRTYKFNTLYGDSRTPWKTGDVITEEIKLVTIFLNMLENDAFRKQFIDTYCVVAGSVFAAKNVNTVVDRMKTYMNSGMALSDESCTSSYSLVRSSFSSTMANTKTNYLKNFAPMKISKEITANLSTNIPEAEIYINNVKVPYGSLSGKIFDDIVLSTSAPEGYKFLGWSTFANSDITEPNISFKVAKTTARYVANWVKMTDEEMIALGKNIKPVVVNEVSASNDVYVSDYYKKADWIELYNNSEKEVNIAGLYLTDNAAKPMKYQIPSDDEKLNTIIPAYGYKVIWCDKKENIGAAIHADFKLEGEQGVVMLSKVEDDAIVYSDTLAYTQHEGTESFGRYPDAGAALYRMTKMTPGAKNICQGDIFAYMTEDKFVTGIEAIADVKKDSGISISYVGDGIVNIKSDNNLNDVAVISASGNIVYNQELSSTFETISLSSLSKGVYVIKVSDANGNTSSRKILK